MPYTKAIHESRGTGYMIEDQRPVARRPDVLVYETDALSEAPTLAGPITADLFVSTTGNRRRFHRQAD